MLVRRFRVSDAFEVSSIIRCAIMERDNRNYTLEQLYSIANYYSADNMCSELDKRINYVCLEDGEIRGTGTLRGDEIMAVFIDPDYQGKGIGIKLMKILENEAVKKGLNRVWLVAVLSAVSFYEKMGYSFIRYKIHLDWGKGVIMEKHLLKRQSAS